MAFQALLFCPDDKTARTLTQILSELEFTVEACTEPFAAVKKLMSQHFDAIVVDCDNEQNATLLFKSARNSTSNQASLAVAIVEGQAGVAKAFRIGANLVLTKPINVEQSKGTLRVARGLLRKGDPGKPAAPAAPIAPVGNSTPVPVKPAAVPSPSAAAKPVAARPAPPSPPSPPKPAAVKPAAPVAPRTVPPIVKPAANVAAAQAAASSGLGDPEDILQITGETPSAAKISSSAPAAPVVKPARPVMRVPFVGAPEGPAASFAGGAASAPAPAREPEAVHVPDAPSAPRHKAEDLFEKPDQLSTPASVSSGSETPALIGSAPSFTFGGASPDVESGGGAKKIAFSIIAAMVICAGLYAGWNHFRRSEPGAQLPVTSSATTTAAPTSTQPPSPKPSASAPTLPVPTAASTDTPEVNSTKSSPSNDENATDESTTVEPRNVNKPASNPAATSAKPAAATKPAESPLVVKGGAVPAVHSGSAVPEAPAPSVIGIGASGSGGDLSGLVGDSSNAPKPVLQTVNISQGVSQGLLLKKIQPTYPRTALAMHVEGIVELMATISKTGDITSVKVLSGDPQLTRAASEAVKQWKYKPYLLNGEPVEIQTQVTISFKLPH